MAKERNSLLDLSVPSLTVSPQLFVWSGPLLAPMVSWWLRRECIRASDQQRSACQFSNRSSSLGSLPMARMTKHRCQYQQWQYLSDNQYDCRKRQRNALTISNRSFLVEIERHHHHGSVKATHHGQTILTRSDALRTEDKPCRRKHPRQSHRRPSSPRHWVTMWTMPYSLLHQYCQW